jgi:hypothetical protein
MDVDYDFYGNIYSYGYSGGLFICNCAKISGLYKG